MHIHLLHWGLTLNMPQINELHPISWGLQPMDPTRYQRYLRNEMPSSISILTIPKMACVIFINLSPMQFSKILQNTLLRKAWVQSDQNWTERISPTWNMVTKETLHIHRHSLLWNKNYVLLLFAYSLSIWTNYWMLPVVRENKWSTCYERTSILLPWTTWDT